MDYKEYSPQDVHRKINSCVTAFRVDEKTIIGFVQNISSGSSGAYAEVFCGPNFEQKHRLFIPTHTAPKSEYNEYITGELVYWTPKVGYYKDYQNRLVFLNRLPRRTFNLGFCTASHSIKYVKGSRFLSGPDYRRLNLHTHSPLFEQDGVVYFLERPVGIVNSDNGNVIYNRPEYKKLVEQWKSNL